MKGNDAKGSLNLPGRCWCTTTRPPPPIPSPDGLPPPSPLPPLPPPPPSTDSSEMVHSKTRSPAPLRCNAKASLRCTVGNVHNSPCTLLREGSKPHQVLFGQLLVLLARKAVQKRISERAHGIPYHRRRH